MSVPTVLTRESHQIPEKLNKLWTLDHIRHPNNLKTFPVSVFNKIINNIVNIMRIVPLSLRTQVSSGGHWLPRVVLHIPPSWPANTGPAARTGVTCWPMEHTRASCFAHPQKSPHLQHQQYSQTSGSFPSASTPPKQPWFLCASVRLESGHVKALAIFKGITLN